MRVAVAEDSGIFRQALVTLLTTVGVDVVVSASTGTELLARIADDPPDVVILDLHMPPTYTNEGMVVARHLLEHSPKVGVPVLSAHNETPQAMELFRDQSRGAGYLLKDHVTDVNTLRAAMERVMKGDIVIDPEVVPFQRRNRPGPAIELPYGRGPCAGNLHETEDRVGGWPAGNAGFQQTGARRPDVVARRGTALTTHRFRINQVTRSRDFGTMV